MVLSRLLLLNRLFYSTPELKVSIDDVKNGQRINCNGANDTVIGKRSTRKRRLVVVKKDNGFSLKLNAQTLSVELSETSRTSRQLEAMAN